MQLRLSFALFLALAVGVYVPDIDRVFPFLLHRSALTHSVLIPLLVALYTRADLKDWKRGAVIGLATGIAVHLCFDLFPQSWRGYAQVSLPFTGWMNGSLSTLWIAANIVACFSLGLRHMQTQRELMLTCAASALAFLLVSQGERAFWLPLFSLLIGWFLATCLPNSVVRGQTLVRQFRQRTA